MAKRHTRFMMIAMLVACSGEAPDDIAEAVVNGPRVEPPAVLTPVEPQHPGRRGPSHFVDDNQIRWELIAEPTVVSMSELESFRITIKATNQGDANVDPERHRGHWTFQGQPHMGLTMWFGNGLRASEWSDLPPGMTVDDSRGPGEHLFEAPGDYEIAFAHGPGRAAIVNVEVRP